MSTGLFCNQVTDNSAADILLNSQSAIPSHTEWQLGPFSLKPLYFHMAVSAVWPCSSVTAALLTLVIVLHWAAKLHGCLRKACERHRQRSLPPPLKRKCTQSVTRSETTSVNQWPGHCLCVDSYWLPDWLDTLTLSLKRKFKPEH